MTSPPLQAHWRFALTHALIGLRSDIRSFDFAQIAVSRQTFTGASPSYLLEVIDGFLGEPELTLLGGERADLVRLRILLVEQVQPAFEEGKLEGRRTWQVGVRFPEMTWVEGLHELAFQRAPLDSIRRGWFVEGFCTAYSALWMESLRPQA